MPPKKAKPEPTVDVPEGDSAGGRAIFDQHCAACHALEGDNKTASAPSLGYNSNYFKLKLKLNYYRGIIGRVTGSTTFPYSKSMKGAGFTWSEKHLFVFLRNPSKYVTGTRMAFAGLESEKERADLIQYLKDN